MEQQRDLEQLVNLTRDDDESNNESDSVNPGPNCRGLGHWRPATKLLGFVVMAFCLALLVFWRSPILTSKRMEFQKEYTAAGNQIIKGGTQTDYSQNCYHCTVSGGKKSQKHPEIADLPADDIICKMMHPPGGIKLPVMGGSQWKKTAAMGGTYCGALMHKLPETLTVGHSVGHAWLMDGTQYVGPWKHGQPDSDCQLVSGHVQCHGGKGTFYYADGKIKHGYWHGTVFCSDDAAVSRSPQCITDWGLVKTLDQDVEGGISSVVFNDKFLAAGGFDNKVRIYSIEEDLKLVKTLDEAERRYPHSVGIYSVALNDEYLAAGGGDNKVRIYSIEEDWKLVKTLEDAERYISSVAFNDEYLAVGSWDWEVRIYYKIWAEEDWKFFWSSEWSSEDAKSNIQSVAFNDKFLAAGGDDNKVRIYSNEDHWTAFKTLEDAEHSITALAFNYPYNKYLAAGGWDNKVRIYSIEEDWKLVKTLDDAESYIDSVAFNDKFLAAGGDDKKVRIYSIEDWKLVKTLEAESYIKSVAFNDKFLAAGGDDKKVRIYSIEE